MLRSVVQVHLAPPTKRDVLPVRANRSSSGNLTGTAVTEAREVTGSTPIPTVSRISVASTDRPFDTLDRRAHYVPKWI